MTLPAPQAGVLQIPPPAEADAPGATMSFLEHLDELRKRIVNSCLAIALGVVVGFGFIDRIFNFIFGPTRGALPPGVKLIYTQPGEAFSLYIQISLIAGIMLASPFVMYQVWMFIAPGLYSNEKKLAVPFVLFTTLGFLLGAAFNHYIAFAFAMSFFASFNGPELAFMPKLNEVFGLYTKMLLGLGIIFQMPTVVFFLAKMQLLTAGFLWKNLRYAILITFVIAAIITPTGDPVNQSLFVAPMMGLYLVSILIAWVVRPKRPEAESTEPA